MDGGGPANGKPDSAQRIRRGNFIIHPCRSHVKYKSKRDSFNLTVVGNSVREVQAASVDDPLFRSLSCAVTRAIRSSGLVMSPPPAATLRADPRRDRGGGGHVAHVAHPIIAAGSGHCVETRMGGASGGAWLWLPWRTGPSPQMLPAAGANTFWALADWSFHGVPLRHGGERCWF